MKSTIIKNLIATTLLTGVVVTAATFNGGATLDLAKAKISDLTTTITQFGTNEKAMKEKIVSLKGEVDTLKTQIATGQGNEKELQTKVKDLETQITTLESQVNEANAEVTKANEQITLANDKAADLQTELDSFNQSVGTIAPMTQEELTALVGDIVVPQEPSDPQEGTQLPEGTYNIKIGETVTQPGFTINVISKDKIMIGNTDQTTSQSNSPYWAVQDEPLGSISYGANQEISYDVNKPIMLKTNDAKLLATINVIVE